MAATTPSSSPAPAPASAFSPSSHSRVTALRARMKDRGIDFVVVRATDRFLNEYVPTDESTRVWLTGFGGSMGDAVIGHEGAWLVVDGRYDLQAAREAPGFVVRVTALGTSIETGWMGLLDEVARGRVVGIESARVSAGLYATIEQRARSGGWSLVSTLPSLVEETRDALGETPAPRGGDVWAIDHKLSGRTVATRLREGFAVLDARAASTTPTTMKSAPALDGLMLTALDEIAWVTNLRGAQFPYQATFRATAIATRDDVLVAADDRALRTGRGQVAIEACVHLVGEQGLLGALDGLRARVGHALTLGYDPSTAPAALVHALQARDVALVEVQSPFASLRTKKTPEELVHMVAGFKRADDVIWNVQKWIHRELSKGHRISEHDVAHKTTELFFASGAFELSFHVIAAAGENGAVIHYGPPDARRILKKGELFLLDTGAYYEGGYATDLTRTFLLGPSTTQATREQKRRFTLVLKSQIAGMSARIPVNATGEQLDAIVRTPMWAAGLDYGHGTGHGVGVNVHESPPRITIGSRVPVEVGQVFSIEPGLYLPGWGGIRIENLATVVPDPITPPNGVARRFLRVQPLTFSPFDQRLIDRRLLTDHEKRVLSWFKHRNPKLLPPVA